MNKEKFENKIGVRLEVSAESWWGVKPFNIDKLQAFLKDAKENTATHVRFGGYCSDNEIETIEIQPVIITEESDEAFNKRVKESEAEAKKEAKQEAEEQERLEREMLKDLKAKYEPNN